MEYDRHANALVLSNELDLKNAALYFPHVVVGNRAALQRIDKKADQDRIIEALLPPAIDPSALNTLRVEAAVLAAVAPSEGHEAVFTDKVVGGVVEMGVRPTSVLGLVPSEVASSRVEPSVLLSGLELTDASTASWESILEFRRDPESKAAFGRLRRFICENYEGREPAFVEDSLADLLERYERARRRWGWGAALGSLAVLLSEDNLGYVASLFECLTSGREISALATAGFAATVAGVGLEVGKLAHEKYAKFELDPVHYLYRAKQL